MEALSLDALTYHYVYHSYIILGISVSPFPLLHTVPCGHTNPVYLFGAARQHKRMLFHVYLLVNPTEYISETQNKEQIHKYMLIYFSQEFVLCLSFTGCVIFLFCFPTN